MHPLLKKHKKIIDTYFSESLLCELKYYHLTDAQHEYHKLRIKEVLSHLKCKSFNHEVSSDELTILAIILFLFSEKTIEYYELKDRKLCTAYYCDDDDPLLQEYFMQLTYISDPPMKLMSFKGNRTGINKVKNYVKEFDKMESDYRARLQSDPNSFRTTIPHVKKMILKMDNNSYDIPPFLINDFVEYTKSRFRLFVENVEHFSKIPKVDSKKPIEKIFASLVSTTLLRFLRDQEQDQRNKSVKVTYRESGVIGSLLVVLGIIDSIQSFTPYDTGHTEVNDQYLKQVDIKVRNYVNR